MEPDREMELLAVVDEAEQLVTTLRNRLTVLNVEVRIRDARIAEYEKAGQPPAVLEAVPDDDYRSTP